jgi:peptide/nickel transport system permease protein
MATEPTLTPTDPLAAPPPTLEREGIDAAAPPASGPWRLGWRRLLRNKVSLAFGVLFVLLILTALAAPLWANHIANTTPDRNRLADQIVVDGKPTEIVSLRGIPIGPTWQGEYFLGADENGRDVMVRLLYGARNSLFIGITAALITTLLAVLLGLIAGYFRGWIDAVISRGLDVLWAFPVLLLGIALGVSLATEGLSLGPIELAGNSLWIPTLIIGFVGIVYLARPIRGQVLALREKEFIEVARAQGMSDWRIMTTELLPNLLSTILVFFPLIVANAILLEAALSFLGAGVQSPSPSWGTMISDGLDRIIGAPHLTIAPGLMLAMTVLSLNIFGEGVRDALDPRAKVRLQQ